MSSYKGSVLIIDDDPRLMNVLSRALTLWGYDVCEVCSAERAEAALANIQFDLILMDYHMSPVMAKELLINLREQRPKTPVIMISGYWPMDGWFEMKSFGASDYLAKPLDYDELQQVVSKALDR